MWMADAHHADGKRVVVHADEKLTAFLELERQVLTVTFYRNLILRNVAIRWFRAGAPDNGPPFVVNSQANLEAPPRTPVGKSFGVVRRSFYSTFLSP
jgi:hypothetical protein